MNDLPEPNGNDPLKQKRNAPESAPLIRMPASEQQQPDALRRCPVCGMPYTLGAELVSAPLPETPSAVESAGVSQPTEPSKQRIVLRCPHCGAYSVGAPPAE